MLVAAYKTHGVDILLNPPKITPQFRIALAQWSVEHNASYTEVAAKFGYLGSQQIHDWKEIYRQQGPNGLLSITKGRAPQLANKRAKRKKKQAKTQLTPAENKIKQLEAENLELRIKLEASKLLASRKLQAKNWRK